MTGRNDRSWVVVAERELLSRPPFITVSAQTIDLPDGRRIDDYYQIELGDFACVYAQTEDRRLVMLRSYRHGPRKVCFNFPGGGIGPKETPAEAAKRELLEETGFEAARWQPLGSFITNSNQRCQTAHFFRADGCHQIAQANSGDLEDSEVILLTFSDALATMRRGDLASLSHAALLGLVALGESGHKAPQFP
jgi:ADP-ribose pyrophosphatase